MGRKTLSVLGAVAVVLVVLAVGLLPRLPHLWGPAPDSVADLHQHADTFDPTKPAGGPFTLVDGDGATVTERSFPGRYLLMYFGYTYCPDVCPTSLQTMRLALEQLTPAALKRVQPLFITVDPERDREADVKEYAGFFHPKLIGLTGTQAQIDAATRAYNVYARKVELKDSAAEYLIDHSAITYLVAPDGSLAAVLQHGIAPESMAEQLQSILGGDEAATGS
jgi:protein SCO1/2